MESRPFIRDIVYVAPQSDWSFPLHTHENAAELSLVLKGKGTLYMHSRHRSIEKGMLVVKNSGVSHAEKSDPDDPLEQICIEIGGVITEELEENQIIPQHMEPVIKLESEENLMCGCFRFLMEHENDSAYRQICGDILELILKLIRQRIVSDYRLGERIRGKKELVTEALAYLDIHYREKIRLKALAEIFYTSEGNLSRQFKTVTGYTVNEYIISKRMGEAQRLLIYEDEDIKEVARKTGYEDIQYFYHVFKSYAHCTPVEFRARYRHG